MPPMPAPCDIQQEPVVVGLVRDDVTAQVENREIEQPLLDQVQEVDDPAGATISIHEGMDGLEPVVTDGKDSLSVVVTMFPISELCFASSRGIVLISITWFGINSAACFSSTTATRASMHAFRIRLVSRSCVGGNVGSSS
jgi:hypothetical protein